jgi:tetratricopeptide (TPR) repeat protein
VKRRAAYCRKQIAMIALMVAPIWSLACLLATAQENQTDVAIRHAKTYESLSLAEQGDTRDLEDAEKLLEQIEAPPEKKASLSAHIEDLRYRIEMSRWTQEGAFPLLGFLTSSLFADSGPTAIYRLIDDPAIQATKHAAADLASLVAELEKKEPPLPVVVTYVATGQDVDRRQIWALEQATRDVFRRSPEFQVQTHSDVENAIRSAAAEVRGSFRAGKVTTAAVEEVLHKAFGPKLLAVVIRPADVVADVYCYQAEGYVLDANNSRRAVLSTSGFARDRRDRLAWILWANAALLIIAFGVYGLVVYTHRTMAGGTWTTFLLLPLVAFAAGRILPHLISSLLGSIRVPPETPVLASFWITSLSGVAFLAMPLLVYWLVAPWLAGLWPSLSPSSRGGALFAAIGSGIAAFLAGPLLLYAESNPAINVTLMSVSVIVLAYLLGRTLDYSDPLPLPIVVVPLILAMPEAAALLHANTVWLAWAAGLIIVTAAAIVVGRAMRRKVRPSPNLISGSMAADNVPADLQELVRHAENPDYQRFPPFEQAWDRVSDILAGHCSHLGLFGPRGAGKTATVGAVKTRLVEQFEERKVHPAVLWGSCPQPIAEPISYAPFREALVQHFEVNLLAPPGPKVQQISQALGGILGSVVPFARILFPQSGLSGDAASRPDEIHASIAWMFRRLSKTRPILLFLDDVQWLDEASATLVKYLLEEFPPGGNTSLAIILLASHKSCLADLGFDVSGHGIEIAYPSEAQQVQILVRGIGIQETVAQEILARTGAPRESNGGLLWPMQVVANLARAGALRRTERGFAWAGGTWPADFAIPDYMRTAIQEQWESAAQYHPILGCAACGSDGLQFSVSVLADALGRTRLELLTVLDEIERNTGMVHDVRDRDDQYAFHSSFLLEVIRDKLGMAGPAAHKSAVPQIVREYHARLGLALEAVQGSSQSRLYEVANHFYAAGARHAEKGVKYCLEAAGASAASYDFRRARNYLDMAEQCAESSGAGPLVEEEKLVVQCQEARVAFQGSQRTKAAESGLAYLKDHPGASGPVVLAIAQLCYEVGHRSREPKWYEDAARLCQQIVAHPASPLEEAEARHIMAVSQPSQRRGERITELRTACSLAERAAATDPVAARWLGQIMNSLAKELSKGSAEERSEAKRLFECRLQLDAQRQLDDLRGTAVAAAGLGRLQWYVEPKNVAAAQKQFERNLEISEAIGDVTAQVKMHSLLGACSLENGDIPSALAHYQRSWELAGDPIDRCFAAVGLLWCYQRHSQAGEFESTAQRLLDVLDGREVPSDCKDQLRAVLKACPASFLGTAARNLANLIPQ